MAFREVTVVQVREALRCWLRGAGERTIARTIGVDRKTARRYIAAAVEIGLERTGGDEQLTDELIGCLVEAVRPHRTDGHGAAWRSLLAEEEQMTAWVNEGLTVVKIGILLERKGVVVPHRTLARFAVERCGAEKRSTTVRVDDPPPGTELQVDFGRLGLVPDGDRRRVCDRDPMSGPPELVPDYWSTALGVWAAGLADGASRTWMVIEASMNRDRGGAQRPGPSAGGHLGRL